MGLGTWGLAEGKHPWMQELEALRLGLDLGLALIDTAEMYADGGAEKLTGEAIAGRRDDVFLVSKVLPQNASRDGVVTACERTLRRLQTDRLDLYLLHWRGEIPLNETLKGFEALLKADKIRYWGVSNFGITDLEELEDLMGEGDITTDQVLYNLTRRGIEYDLMPWCRQRDIPIMAYSPIEQGQLLDDRELRRVAEHHKATPAQVALAWLIRQEGVIAIPRARVPAHVRENRGALEVHLSQHDLAALDRAFPPPSGSRPLEML
jgi:diketogulonate reductase-like aldo/keto reductase